MIKREKLKCTKIRNFWHAENGSFRRNKKAQFFVIFAVILGILILAASSIINFAKSAKNIDSFNAKCENYKNEIFEISKYAANNQEEEFSLIRDFSVSFIDYMNDSYNISMYFLHGNNLTSTQVNIPLGTIDTYHKPSVTINYNKFTREYILSRGNSFHFLMIARKNNEVYVCE